MFLMGYNETMDEAKNQANDVKDEVKTEALPEQEKPKPTYRMYERDFSISDCDLFDYYKTRMKMLVMHFMLVGRFDEEGRYKIREDIKYDLVKMYKEIEDSGEDFYRASTQYMGKFFYFNVKIEQIEDGKAKASLMLSEFVDDFLEEPYIVSHIADFIDVYDEHFRVKVRQAFNMYDVAMTNDDARISALAVLMQDEYDINEYVGGLYDLASQIYLMRMLKLLESGGEVGQKIIARYKELALDVSEDDKEKHKFTRQKALLDRAIDEFGGLEKLPVDANELKSIVVEINKSVKAIDGLQKRTSITELVGKDEKIDFEKKAGKKTSSKSKSKSGGGGGKSGGGSKKDKGGKKGKDKEEKAPKSKGVVHKETVPAKIQEGNTDLAEKILSETNNKDIKKEDFGNENSDKNVPQTNGGLEAIMIFSMSPDEGNVEQIGLTQGRTAGQNQKQHKIEPPNKKPEINTVNEQQPSKNHIPEQNKQPNNLQVVAKSTALVVNIDGNEHLIETQQIDIAIEKSDDEREME